MGPALEIGDRFIRHVYILTICLTVVISAVLLGFKRAALPSFLIGSAISLSLFWSIEFVVRRLVRPGKTKRTKSLLGFIAIGKYTVLAGLLYLLFKMEWMNIYAFAGGIALVQGAIIIKAIGLMVAILSNKDPNQS
ncbi:MAG: ATP synthase subunit I [Candidatus Poribacteria bacterium]|nr:ATP synthase subunit I [Candidatus Poribacteria bacterium]